MKLKKNPKADLESKKGIFVLIGLIISLSLSILAYESKSYDNLDVGFGDSNMDDLDEEDIDITRPEPPPPPFTRIGENPSSEVPVPAIFESPPLYPCSPFTPSVEPVPPLPIVSVLMKMIMGINTG